VYDHFSGDLKWKESGTVTYNMPHYLDYNYHDINDKGHPSYSDFQLVSVTIPSRSATGSGNAVQLQPDLQSARFFEQYGYAL